MSKTIVQNRRARFDYFIEETLEAGIVLHGTEIKTLRTGRVNLNSAYAGEEKGEIYLFGVYIPEYTFANPNFQHVTRRPRKLLLHRRQKNKLMGAILRSGMTLVPLSLYFSTRGLVKVELGLARGKRQIDKREIQKKRDWQREKARFLQKSKN